MMPIYTPNTLLFIAVACVVFGLIARLRGAGADFFRVLEAWISAFFMLTMVTNVLCSGKFKVFFFPFSSKKAKNTTSAYYHLYAVRTHRGDRLEDFRHQKSYGKLDNHLANRARLRWEQHAVHFERHRGAYNVLEQF